MGTTPTYSLRYPDAADPADVPTDMHELATDVEAAITAQAAASLGMRRIQDILVGATPLASLDFTSIPQTYSHLRLVTHLRDTGAGTSLDAVLLRFNNDSSALYDSQTLRATGTATPVASETIAGTSFNQGVVTAGGTTGGWACTNVYEIPNYTSVYFVKTIAMQYAAAWGPSTGLLWTGTSTGIWRQAVAVTRITLTSSVGSFAQGSRATLYGLS